jgi:hypothetical protein
MIDTQMDLEDLHSLMRVVMQAGSDIAVVGMMQVEREAMLEVMKTLQRALERMVVREQCVGQGDRGRQRGQGRGQRSWRTGTETEKEAGTGMVVEERDLRGIPLITRLSRLGSRCYGG